MTNWPPWRQALWLMDCAVSLRPRRLGKRDRVPLYPLEEFALTDQGHTAGVDNRERNRILCTPGERSYLRLPHG